MATATPDERHYAMTLPLTTAAARQARQVVRDQLSSWDLREHVDTVELVMTELVTKAMQHGGPGDTLDLKIAADDRRIRVTVIDGSAVRPVAREVEAEEISGRGMHIVEQLADRWGTGDDPGGGKQVWVELQVADPTKSS